MTGFVFLALFILAAGFISMYYNLLLGSPTFSYALSDLMLPLALLCPILCYDSIAKERRLSIEKTLYSLPVRSTDIVLGKYLSITALLLISSVILAFFPLIFNFFGEVNFASAYLSLLAFFLFGCAVSAVFFFFSSLFKKRAACLVACYSFVAVMYLIQIVSLFFEKQHLLFGIPSKFFFFIGIFNRFESFVYGAFDVSTLIYYLSITVFFVFLAVVRFEKRRYEVKI